MNDVEGSRKAAMRVLGRSTNSRRVILTVGRMLHHASSACEMLRALERIEEFEKLDQAHYGKVSSTGVGLSRSS